MLLAVIDACVVPDAAHFKNRTVFESDGAELGVAVTNVAALLGRLYDVLLAAPVNSAVVIG